MATAEIMLGAVSNNSKTTHAMPILGSGAQALWASAPV